MDALPEPEVVRYYRDETFHPRLPAMCLRWEANPSSLAERLWYLPEGVCLVGPAPESFGVTVQRNRPDSYSVRLLWDRTCLNWPTLTRVQLLTSALSPILRALGTDLAGLLDQPVKAEIGLTKLAV